MAGQSLGTILGRAFRLRCPKCGGGRMFSGLLRMHDRCSECGLVYERDPGYFLGSSYVNYGFTALTLTPAYVTLHYAFGWTNTQLAFPLVGWVLVFPVFFFRYARALWLGMDVYFDPQSFEDPAESEQPEPPVR